MAQYRQALCPVCGTAHGTEVTERISGKPYMAYKKRNYWERVKEFDPNKPFGVIQEAAGRGSFKLVGYFSPEEDTDGFFPLIRQRLLAAVGEWVTKGWMTREQVIAILGEVTPDIVITKKRVRRAKG